MATEVITTTDKSKRDQMFQDLRKSDNSLERQVTKFSGVELVQADPSSVPVWVSNWSVAYPTR
jgi:hypothetical protein